MLIVLLEFLKNLMKGFGKIRNLFCKASGKNYQEINDQEIVLGSASRWGKIFGEPKALRHHARFQRYNGEPLCINSLPLRHFLSIMLTAAVSKSPCLSIWHTKVLRLALTYWSHMYRFM